MGNNVFFQPKKLMERLYLLGLFELSMIFQDLGNMVFRAVHLHLSQLINHYSDGDIIDLPPYHGCNRLNRIGTRKETEYKLGY